MIQKNLLCILLFVVILISSASGQDVYKKKIILELNNYRYQLISDSIFNKEIKKIASKYKASLNYSIIDTYYDLLALHYENDHPNLDELQYLKEQRFEEFQNVSEIKKELEFLNKYPELFLLMEDKFISRDYPYRLRHHHFMFDELFVCKVDTHHIVAEIGVGTGFFAYLLSRVFRPRAYHLNEIDTSIVYFFPKINKFHEDSLQNDCQLILGNETVTNLQGKYDKIIIRNTFHHFKKKALMLENIKQHLAPAGELVVIEVFQEDSDETLDETYGSYSCFYQMKEKKILSYFEKAKLEVVSKHKFLNRSMFVFKKSN
jgi:ubiquinone/menaquinone biosynthesis C-methylase UbiE